MKCAHVVSAEEFLVPAKKTVDVSSTMSKCLLTGRLAVVIKATVFTFNVQNSRRSVFVGKCLGLHQRGSAVSTPVPPEHSAQTSGVFMGKSTCGTTVIAMVVGSFRCLQCS